MAVWRRPAILGRRLALQGTADAGGFLVMSDYQPVSCEFHDVLESLATARTHSAIEYRDADGALRKTAAVIQDVYARDGAEYVALDSGQILRLDMLVAVGGARLSDF
jgi:Rho-binding antiterminator